MLARELAVTNDESAYIYSQIGVTLHEISDREDKNARCENHDRVQRFVGQSDTAHQFDQSATEEKADYCTHDELDNDRLYNL